MMIGYSSQSKGYKLWDADLRRVVVSRSVTFELTLTDTVDIDTDSDSDEEVQTAPATAVMSVPVLAQLQTALELQTAPQVKNVMTVQLLLRNRTSLCRNLYFVVLVEGLNLLARSGSVPRVLPTLLLSALKLPLRNAFLVLMCVRLTKR